MPRLGALTTVYVNNKNNRVRIFKEERDEEMCLSQRRKITEESQVATGNQIGYSGRLKR